MKPGWMRAGFALMAAFLLKFWKVAALAVFGVLALLPKVLGRKKQPESAPPPQT